MIHVPAALRAYHLKYEKDAGQAWSESLPGLAQRYLDAWDLTLDGPPGHGMVALVLPVVRSDGSKAALKLQPPNEENDGEAVGLRTWAGDGSVLLLDEDRDSGALLLERLDAGRPLSGVQDDDEALRILSELLARLTAVPAPPGLRRLEDVARAMLADVQDLVGDLGDEDARWLRRCAGAVAELVDESGDRLLHWDLHYDNVLAGEREPWLAIDPKPLAGDPGFDLLPALWNRWDDVVASGNIHRAVRRRFDLMTSVLGLDRDRAAGWTLGRVLQDALWNIEDGEPVFGAVLLPVAQAVG